MCFTQPRCNQVKVSTTETKGFKLSVRIRERLAPSLFDLTEATEAAEQGQFGQKNEFKKII